VLGYVYQPNNLVEHVWRNGDLVIWDNVGTQHARGSVAGVGRRTLQKVQGGGQDFSEWHAYNSPELQQLLAVQSGR
jgi:alpha-ketoglutarate-dependent taurine dioxygenase